MLVLDNLPDEELDLSLWRTTKTAVVASTKSQWPTKTPETWVGGTVRNLPTHLNRSCAAMWQDRFSSGWACGTAVTRSQSRDSGDLYEVFHTVRRVMESDGHRNQQARAISAMICSMHRNGSFLTHRHQQVRRRVLVTPQDIANSASFEGERRRSPTNRNTTVSSRSVNGTASGTRKGP